MNQTKKKTPGWKHFSLGVLATMTLSAYAAVSEQEAARLGAELTPTGAEKAASKDGTIPEWKGGMSSAPAGWKPGHVDPFADDKPLYSIDASNVDQYKDKLPEGQIALIKAYKGYRMDVYPTRRSCTFPGWFQDQTRKNATHAATTEEGWKLAKAFGGGLAFPIPKTGYEAMWNFKTRYVGYARRQQISAVLPEKDGSYTENKQWFYDWYPFADPKMQSPQEVSSVESKQIYELLTPASRAGEVYLIHTFHDQPSDAWIYFPGQRRVRRAPAFAYDNPIAGFDNLYFVDQINMFSGALDRYDLKLIGKKEMVVPYNSYKLIDKKNKIKDLIKPDFIDRDKMRYEVHRVWEVEATVKSDKRHSFAKRKFYFDEDSWALLHVDMYDAKGNLWRVQEGSLWASPDIKACVTFEQQMYDLVARRYAMDNWTQEGDVIELEAANREKYNDSFFSAGAIRRMGER